MCFLLSVIIVVSCVLLLRLKSCDRDIVKLSQELIISMSSKSSAEMRWSVVGRLYPAMTVMDCPDLMVIGDSVPALGLLRTKPIKL